MNLVEFDKIVVNSSAGKDSQAMLDYVVEVAGQQGVGRDRIVVCHCDLGEMEWPGTRELAEEHARHYGLRFEVVSRTKRTLLEEVEARGKWPSSGQRYCTSYYKREPGLKLMTRLGREGARRILNCYGFRAQESSRRRKLPSFERYHRACTSVREVHTWLPIQDWTVDQVWSRIRSTGTRVHGAYGCGMPRLSCRFCVFAPKGALVLSARMNPELFEEYLAVERRIGHKFREDTSLQDVADAVAAGEAVGEVTDDWNM